MNFRWILKIKWRWNQCGIKTKIFALSGLFCVFFGVFLTFQKKTLELEVFEPKVISPYEVRLESLITLNSENIEYLSVKRGGKLDKLFFNVGDKIKQGQILAVVDQTILRSSVEAALSAWNLSVAELNRVKKLAASSSATQAELDIAQNQYTAKRAELEQAKQRLEDGLIKATRDGVISEIVFKEGDNVSDGSRILAVKGDGKLRILFEIQHDRYEEVQLSKKLDLWCNSEQKDKVVVNNFKIFKTDISQQLASSKLELYAELEDVPKDLKLNNTCKTSLLLASAEHVYQVGFEKIYYEDGKPFLLALDDTGKVHKRSIKVLDTKIGDLFVTMEPSFNEKFVTIKDKNLMDKNVLANIKKFKIKLKI